MFNRFSFCFHLFFSLINARHQICHSSFLRVHSNSFSLFFFLCSASPLKVKIASHARSTLLAKCHGPYIDGDCAVPESSRKYPYPHLRGSLEIPRGKGVLKAKNFFEGKYKPKLEFPEGWWFKPKKPSIGGVWIFSGSTHSFLICNEFRVKIISN